LLPALRQAPSAVVGFVASSFAWLPAPGKAAYAASKAALVRAAECLAAELHGGPVAVVIVYPGPIATEIAARGQSTDPRRAEREHRFLQERGASPEAVARAVVRALRRRKPRARLGAFVTASDWLARLAPALLPRLAGRFRRRLPF
jgi:short-subunit dehydrogenase